MLREWARAPFNNTKADIVLQSSDNVCFRVFRCMLVFASPFFDAMFDLPQPVKKHDDDDTFDGLDVIHVSENSRTLDTLLRFCYPAAIKDPILTDFSELEKVLEAAMKYAMEDVEERVRKAIISQPLLESNPFLVFGIAYRYGLQSEAEIAARHSLHLPLQSQHPPLPDNAIQLLVEYRSRCTRAARMLCDNVDWFKQSQSHSFYEWWTSCCSCVTSEDVRYLAHATYPRDWWVDYMDETSVALQESPCGAAVTKNLAKAVERANNCPSCRRRANHQMVCFSKTFACELDRTIAKIPLDISMCFGLNRSLNLCSIDLHT